MRCASQLDSNLCSKGIRSTPEKEQMNRRLQTFERARLYGRYGHPRISNLFRLRIICAASSYNPNASTVGSSIAPVIVQAVIALEIRDSRPRIDAQRACDWTISSSLHLARRSGRSRLLHQGANCCTCRPAHHSRNSSAMDRNHRLDTSSSRPGNNIRWLRKRWCHNDCATSFGHATRASDGGTLRQSRHDPFCCAIFCRGCLWVIRASRAEVPLLGPGF